MQNYCFSLLNVQICDNNLVAVVLMVGFGSLLERSKEKKRYQCQVTGALKKRYQCQVTGALIFQPRARSQGSLDLRNQTLISGTCGMPHRFWIEN